MNISCFKSNISFQKKIVAKASILKNGETKPCNIFLLDRKDDKEYFLNMRNREKWQHSPFLKCVEEGLASTIKQEEIYVLEDKKENCLGILDIYNLKNKKEILFVETCPAYASSCDGSKIKYVGETLLSFITKLAQKDKNEKVTISVPTSSARPFYLEKCRFVPQQECPRSIELPKNRFGKLLLQNKAHTGSEVKLT